MFSPPIGGRSVTGSLTPIQRGARLGPGAALLGYAFAVGAPLAAILVLRAFPLGVGTTYFLFYPVVMLAAVLGGVGPGLLATVLSATLAALWLLPGAHQRLDGSDWAGIALFTAMGCFMSVVARFYRQARQRVARAEREAAVREAETRAVRQREEVLHRYELLAANSRDIILFIRRDDGRILEANAAAVAAYGYSRQELRGLTVHDLRSPETLRVTREQMAAADDCGILFETVHRRKDGSTFPVEVSSRGATLDGVRTLLSVIRDISERRTVEEALRTSERRLRTLAEALPHLVFTADAGGRVDWLNHRWHDYTGQSQGAEDWEAALHPDDRDRVRGRWAWAVGGGHELVVEHRLRRADGAHRWFQLRAIPLRDAAGVVTGWFGACTDVHELKLSQEALRQANQEKSDFLAVLSHELRNPLAPIRISLQMLREAPGSEAAARALEVLQRQTLHVMRMVEDLLDISRLGLGKIDLRRERLDLREVVRHTRDDHLPLFAELGVALHHAEPEQAVWIDGDPVRLTQVVGNLLHNAAKYTPRGGNARVELVAAERHAEVWVRDDGVGMEPGQVARVFEAFAQADGSLARTHGGLGLGLAIVKGVVERHGGCSAGRSAGPGRGAEFVVALPLARGPRPASPEPSQADAIEPLDVLVIEDYPDSGQAMADLLEARGHRVRLAGDGRSGLAAARARRPDVVLCDIGLPDMDGYEVGRILRAAGDARPWLVALTGCARPEERERALAAGFDAHTAKPASIEEIERHLRSASTWRTRRASLTEVPRPS